MTLKRFRFTAAIVGLFVVATGTTRASVILATGGNGSALENIDTATGAGTTIGSSGYLGNFAAALDETTGTLFTVVDWATPGNSLATFDTTTGAATPVSGTPFGVDFLLALSRWMVQGSSMEEPGARLAISSGSTRRPAPSHSSAARDSTA